MLEQTHIICFAALSICFAIFGWKKVELSFSILVFCLESQGSQKDLKILASRDLRLRFVALSRAHEKWRKTVSIEKSMSSFPGSSCPETTSWCRLGTK